MSIPGESKNLKEFKELILIRHGQSTANASGVWQGQLDFPLSPRGRLQARRAGEALRSANPEGQNHGTSISGLYTSPLSRARETAELVAEAAGFPGEIVPVADLMERSGGLFEGTTREEREREIPELEAKFRAAAEEGWSVIGAETDREILSRFIPALEGILSGHRAGERIVVVSHGGVLRAYLRCLFGPEKLSGDERLGNASITRTEWLEDFGEPPRLTGLADSSHLPKDEPPTLAPTSE